MSADRVIPKGCAVVPYEPTAWMVSEARRYLFSGNSETNIEMAWQAMIDASLSRPTDGDTDVG